MGALFEFPFVFPQLKLTTSYPIYGRQTSYHAIGPVSRFICHYDSDMDTSGPMYMEPAVAQAL